MDDVPLGFKLRHVLRGHSQKINRIAWSPNGHILASPSNDCTIHLWDTQTGQSLRTLTGDAESFSVTWSPNGRILAAGNANNTIHFWDTHTGQHLKTFQVHSGCRNVAWSPNGRFLASCSSGQVAHIWDMESGSYLQSLVVSSGGINSIAWSSDGQILAAGTLSHARPGSYGGAIHLWDINSWNLRTFNTPYSVYTVAWSFDGKALFTGSSDQSIRIWDIQEQRQIQTLEGHTGVVTSISSIHQGEFIASKSYDGPTCVWRTKNWEMIGTFEKARSHSWFTSLAFHPQAPSLAVLDNEDTEIRIWDLNVETLSESVPIISSLYYTNAKVVLVGDSGVGKTGLSLVLTGQSFTPTESTHGRHVWTFDSQKVENANGRTETRETLLWDLAGQPGYRLVHQLHLNEVAVTLLVFDAHDEADPFAGIHYWARALRISEHIQGNASYHVKKFLVAARGDRGGKSVSHERIDKLVQTLGFDGYFETSAKEGWGIEQLTKAIRNAIDWRKLPRVVSTDLFQQIKDFLIEEREERRLMSTTGELYRTFLKSKKLQKDSRELRAQFETCIGRVEAADLIRRLSFGNLVLLRPELLDAYASALVTSVKDEPDGLGSISEIDARNGRFRMPADERLHEKEQEKLLLIAMIEVLLDREIVLREGADLVFPAQSTRDYPELSEPSGKAVVFGFEGPVLNIYATLAVRLAHSGIFRKKEIWRNAITYTASSKETCGIFLHNTGEGRGEFILFFDENASEHTRFYFENYVHAHLQRQTIPISIQRRRIFSCPKCGTAFSDIQVLRRRELSFDWIRCNVCDTEISILDREERFAKEPISHVATMDRLADSQREREVAASIIQGKIATGDFDVFLCHNGKNKIEIKRIGHQLKAHGILPWLDEWELQPGLPWQRLLQEQIKQIKSAAVFVGKEGISPWEHEELDGLLSEFVKRGCPVIPVLLPSVLNKPELPIFLKNRTWVDFRQQSPNPLEQLIWGITGKRDWMQLITSIDTKM